MFLPKSENRTFTLGFVKLHSLYWQQNNKPIELWSNSVIQQKLDNIHNNPVEAGFVTEPQHWKYSSAVNFSGGMGAIEIDKI